MISRNSSMKTATTISSRRTGERSEYYYIPQPSQLPSRLHHTQWVGDRTRQFLSERDTSRPFCVGRALSNRTPAL